MQFKKQKILLLIAAIWIVLLATLFIGVNLLIGSGIIHKIILNNTGLEYQTKNLNANFDLNFNLNIKADSIDITNKDKNKKFITIKNPEISFKPLGLLFKKVYFKKINSDSILINIKRDENGNIDLLNAIKENDFDNFNFQLTRLNSNIKTVKLNFTDEYKIKNNTTLVLDNSNIHISKKKNYILINEKGIIETSINNKNTEKSDINIDIKSDYKIEKPDFKIDLNNINLYLFSDFIKKYISEDILSLNGKADLALRTNDFHNLNLKISSPYLKLKEGKVINPYKEVNLVSKFLFKKDKILLNNLDILSNELNVNISGEIVKPFSAKPDFELNTEIKNTQLNNLLYFIPDNLIFYRPQGIPILKKTNIHGLINGKIISKFSPLDITGNVKIENIHIPGYPKPYQRNDATLFFMKDKMRLYTRVYTPDNEYVTVDGVSNLDNSLYGRYNIKSTKNIDLSFAQLYLVPIQQVIGFNIGPVPIMDIKGYGNIDIKTQGTIKDAQIFGQFSAHNATALIHGLDVKLTNGDCKLIFDNRNLIFKEVKGNIDNAQFLLTGIGNTKGEVELKTQIKDIYASKIFKVFNNSVLTRDYTSIFKNISALSGLMDTEINLKGTIKDYEKEDFLNDLDFNGKISFKNNNVILSNGLGAKKINGSLNFDNKLAQSATLEFNINNSKFNTTFDVKDNLSKIASGNEINLDLILNSQKCALSDILNELKKYSALNKTKFSFIKDFNDIDFYSKINLNLKTKVAISNMKFNDLKAKGYIVGLNSSKNKNIHFEHGLIKIDNNNIIFDNFKAMFFDGVINAKGESENGLRIFLNNLSLDKFDKLLPKTKLQNTTIKSGEIFIHKNDLKLNAINIDYNKMPVVLNLAYKLNSKDGGLSADFSTILNETNADWIINPYLSYPVKIKGEIPVKGKFSGAIQNYSIDFTTTIPKGSDIYFSGANIGDIEQERELSGKINANRNILTLNNLKLVKYIKNQNNKTNPLTAISLNGQIIQKPDGVYFNNFKIITQNPINVRILNLIFKKSILKKGNFICNVNLSGKVSAPKIIGKIDLQDLDIPLYDTQINDIKINITQNNIIANIIAKNGQSDLRADIYAVNSFIAPYIINKISIISNKLNIHDILSDIPMQNTKTDIVEKQEFLIKPQDIIIKEGDFNFSDIAFNKISAKNLKGNFSYKDNLFNMKHITFDIAKGRISGSGNYGLNSTKLNLRADMKDCDANILAKDFLNISGQIYGLMTGTIDLTAKNINTPDNIKNVDSVVNFTIDNGKMPKLGSLEYLLRAGNILKNGFMGLSLNNLIQVLTPYKTGEFEKISGNLKISKGEIKNLEIISKGKNLSMYLSGEYKILENFADINIYGRLSQNISSALGAFGNASLKQFIGNFIYKKDSEREKELQEQLNKIPLVEGSNQNEYFSAKVYGDINKDNYIKKFNWE